MSYYAKPNYIQYDEWFDNNIDPCELEYEKEKKFSDSVHDLSLIHILTLPTNREV